MKFYCECCDLVYEQKELQKTRFQNLTYTYQCPECENIELKAIIQNTQLGVSWDESSESIKSIEYDTESYEIIKSHDVSLKTIATVIKHHIDYFGLDSLEIEGLKIEKIVKEN